MLVDKTVSNIKAVKARGANVLAITTEDKTRLSQVVDNIFYVPNICDLMSTSLSVIPLQIFSYYVALNKGCDIDKPRNLAKSVTVE